MARLIELTGRRRSVDATHYDKSDGPQTSTCLINLDQLVLIRACYNSEGCILFARGHTIEVVESYATVRAMIVEEV